MRRTSPGAGPIVQLITHLGTGGAQETMVSSAVGLASSGQHVVVMAGPPHPDEKDTVRRLAEVAIPIVRIPAMERALGVTDPIAFAQLVRAFRRCRPSVVHTHSSKAGILGRIAARVTGVPLIVHTVHGWSFRDYDRPWMRALYVQAERVAARCCERLVVVATNDQQIGSELRIGRPDQYVMIRSGIDVDGVRLAATTGSGRLREQIGIGASDPLVGTVARLAHPKDPETLLRAFERVLHALPGVRLAVVGDGPDRPGVEKLIDDLGIGSSVHLVGSRSDVPELLGDMDVFVLSTLSEGMPRTVVEAMAAGVPVVASRVGGIPEVVEDGRSGVLVPAADVEALADALVFMLTRPEQARAMASEAAGLVDGFDQKLMVRDLCDLYRLDSPVAVG